MGKSWTANTDITRHKYITIIGQFLILIAGTDAFRKYKTGLKKVSYERRGTGNDNIFTPAKQKVQYLSLVDESEHMVQKITERNTTFQETHI